MAQDKITSFNEKTIELVSPLLEQLGYKLKEIKISEHRNMNWSTRLFFTNTEKGLEIQIREEPYYTDYGFSFWIYNIKNGLDNILYNIPHEKQGNDLTFYEQAINTLFSTPETLKLIKGEDWYEFNGLKFFKK